MGVAITRKELIIKSEDLLMRLQKENRKLRRVHKFKDTDKIKTLSRLQLAYDLLAERIANDSLLLAAEESTLLGLTLQERQDRTALKKDIADLANLAKMIRDLAGQVIQDFADENSDELGNYDEKNDALARATKLIDETEFAQLNTIDMEVEVLV